MPALGIPTGGSNKEYPGKLTPFVTVTCIVAAMGGLIFGYGIGISGGVTSMDPFLLKFFPSVYHKKNIEVSTSKYCRYDSRALRMFIPSLYLAALLSSLAASSITRRFGRKLSIFCGGLLFLIGALVNSLAQNILMFKIFYVLILNKIK
ncbi:unnamed protein product [Lathyrus oleraceus]